MKYHVVWAGQGREARQHLPHAAIAFSLVARQWAVKASWLSPRARRSSPESAHVAVACPSGINPAPSVMGATGRHQGQSVKESTHAPLAVLISRSAAGTRAWSPAALLRARRAPPDVPGPLSRLAIDIATISVAPRAFIGGAWTLSVPCVHVSALHRACASPTQLRMHNPLVTRAPHGGSPALLACINQKTASWCRRHRSGGEVEPMRRRVASWDKAVGGTSQTCRQEPGRDVA